MNSDHPSQEDRPPDVLARPMPLTGDEWRAICAPSFFTETMSMAAKRKGASCAVDNLGMMAPKGTPKPAKVKAGKPVMKSPGKRQMGH